MLTSTTHRPAGWKNYEDFAAGIATNRLPPSDALLGRRLRLNLSFSQRRPACVSGSPSVR